MTPFREETYDVFYLYQIYADGHGAPIGSGYDSFEECKEANRFLWSVKHENDYVVGYCIERSTKDFLEIEP